MLGFWRPAGVLKNNLRPALQAGHWEFNAENWNALAGFLKYLPWDSTRFTVEENVVQHDQRILVWRTKKGKMGIVVSNRGTKPYTFHLTAADKLSLTGHRYTVKALDVALGKKAGSTVDLTVEPQSYEFWIER